MPKAKSSSAQRRQRKEELRRQRRQERLAKHTGADIETLGRAVLEEMAEEMRQQGDLPDAEIRFNPPGQRKMSEVLRADRPLRRRDHKPGAA